jgi:hypothetical protein
MTRNLAGFGHRCQAKQSRRDPARKKSEEPCREEAPSVVSPPEPHTRGSEKGNAMSSPFVWFHHNGAKSKETQNFENLLQWKGPKAPA